jgi:hypothetical protein
MSISSSTCEHYRNITEKSSILIRPVTESVDLRGNDGGVLTPVEIDPKAFG